MELIAKMNYGLAGPHFLQHADETRIQENYQRALERISQSAKSDIAYRIGSNLAALLAIGDEVNRVFGISDQDAWTITGSLILELLQDASTIDRASEVCVYCFPASSCWRLSFGLTHSSPWATDHEFTSAYN